MQADGLKTNQRTGDKGMVFGEDPSREKLIGAQGGSGVGDMFAGGDLGLEGQALDGGVVGDGGQDIGRPFTGQQPPVVGDATARRHHRVAGVGFGDNVSQRHDGRPQERFAGQFECFNGGDHLHHLQYRVTSQVRRRRMGWSPGGCQVDFRPSAPAPVQVEIRRLADDDKVRFDRIHDGAQGDAFQHLFQGGGADDDAARQLAVIDGGGSVDHSGQCAFHVRRATAIDRFVDHLRTMRFLRPGNAGGNADRVNVGVEQQGGAGLRAFNDADDAAVFIDRDGGEAERLHLGPYLVGHWLFLAAQAGALHEGLDKFN